MQLKPYSPQKVKRKHEVIVYRKSSVRGINDHSPERRAMVAVRARFDPASEADKRSDPPAEGESVEAGGNECED